MKNFEDLEHDLKWRFEFLSRRLEKSKEGVVLLAGEIQETP